MTILVLFVLAIVWAVYLVSWIRSRTEHTRHSGVANTSPRIAQSSLRRRSDVETCSLAWPEPLVSRFLVHSLSAAS
jgi:hypothetical protein